MQPIRCPLCDTYGEPDDSMGLVHCKQAGCDAIYLEEGGRIYKTTRSELLTIFDRALENIPNPMLITREVRRLVIAKASNRHGANRHGLKMNVHSDKNPTQKEMDSISTLERITLDDKRRIANRGYYRAFRGGYVHVKMPDTVVNIGDEAFRQCTSLAVVTLPPQLTEIKGGLFWGCESLRNITIPSNVETIGDHAFYECLSLERVDLPDNIGKISGYAFAFCENMKYMNHVTTQHDDQTFVPGTIFIPSTVYYIGQWAFQGCKWIKNLIIPNSVEVVESGAFLNCHYLQTAELSNIITNIDALTFGFCINLLSISIPASVKYVEDYAFLSCWRLKEVSYYSNHTYFDPHAFADCPNVTFIDLYPKLPPNLIPYKG